MILFSCSDNGLGCLNFDCTGECGGDAILDECGVCNGDNTLCFGSSEGLDIITWNIQNFPKNNNTIDSLSSMMNTLAVDIFSLQEIESTQSLNILNLELGENWESYRSNSNSSSGELSYLINTDEIEIIQAPYAILQQYSHEFASREPYVLEFTHNDSNYILINIHYKCCDGSEERRMQASIYLEDYISTNFSNERLILLGDFNDLLIDTYNVFDPFLSDPTNYEFGDYYIAEDPSALWSFPSWPSHIDHILVTNELFEVYDVKTIAIDQLFFNSLTDYDNLISDHRPLIIQISITP